MDPLTSEVGFSGPNPFYQFTIKPEAIQFTLPPSKHLPPFGPLFRRKPFGIAPAEPPKGGFSVLENAGKDGIRANLP
jgi:hypothetical protein